MNRIQVFGAGCARCDRLRKNVEAAVAELGVETKVETVSRIEEIIECGVLVTPALLRRLPAEGIADKELSALLARERLVPIVHGTTYEALREVSPLLASRSGLSTAENPMADVAAKLAEPVALPSPGVTGVN